MTVILNNICWKVAIIIVFVLYNLCKPVQVLFSGEAINQIFSSFYFSDTPYRSVSPLHHRDASISMPAPKNKAPGTCIDNHIVSIQV